MTPTPGRSRKVLKCPQSTSPCTRALNLCNEGRPTPTSPYLLGLIFLALALPSDLTNEGDLCNEVNTRSFVFPPEKPLPPQVTFPPPHNLG
uniref:Uncharacterized protein n=1 Tax=Picea glauca TaxID=3330 RepID=A0A124GP37_PICGL|nr:hypothetical protein ABT39_MTgene577 [Picea glauca]